MLGGAPAGQRRRQAAALLLTLPLQLVGLPCLRIDTITLLAFPQISPPPLRERTHARRPARPRAGSTPARCRAMSTSWHETCSGDAHCEINFESRDGKLFADDTPFSIKGVNW